MKGELTMSIVGMIIWRIGTSLFFFGLAWLLSRWFQTQGEKMLKNAETAGFLGTYQAFVGSCMIVTSLIAKAFGILAAIGLLVN